MRWFSHTADRFGKSAGPNISRRARPSECRRIQPLRWRLARLELLEDRRLLSIGGTGPDLLAPQPIPMEPFASPVVYEPVSPDLGFLNPVGAPTSFDLRNVGGQNYLTPVKDQGFYGTCWTFATFASLESNILINGGTTEDFAERPLAFHGFDWGYNTGGTAYVSSAELTAARDPFDESEYPYSGMPTDPGVEGTLSTVHQYVREMPVYDTAVEIKSAIMSRGALYTSFYVDDPYFNAAAPNNEYYYYPASGGAATNHAVCIVGWDDNISAANFSGTGGPAPGNGAWLIRNSWGGTYQHGDGYFWISYYDKYMTEGTNGLYGASFSDAVDLDQPGTYQTLYKHDDFGKVYTWPSMPTVVNAFTATADEDLVAVNFWTTVDGDSYDIRIYDSFSTASGPSGLLAQETGTVTTWGNHTVDLTTSVQLTTNDDFYIWLDLGSEVMVSDGLLSSYSSNCTADTGESYYYSSGSWYDLNVTSASYEANWSVKGLTELSEPQQDYDFGDAPDTADGLPSGNPYPTLLEDNGARHFPFDGPYLGVNSADYESDGQPNATATGDDSDGYDDEDGVVIPASLPVGSTSTIQVTVSGAGTAGVYLDAWIDFNSDGDWNDPGEQIYSTSNGLLYDGVVNIQVTPPVGSVAGQTFARFRLSSQGSLLPTGAAYDGEVEDYEVFIEASQGEYDFGDAPDPSYPTLLASNGASHTIVSGFYLGNSVDGELDGQPNATATGDDTDGNDDEDGVTFNTALFAGVPNTITVTAAVPAGTTAYLSAWIDLNGNGDWADLGEQLLTDKIAVNGVNSYTFTPALLTATGSTFARFRLSSQAGLSYDGAAPDGEVEDYEIEVVPVKWIQNARPDHVGRGRRQHVRSLGRRFSVHRIGTDYRHPHLDLVCRRY